MEEELDTSATFEIALESRDYVFELKRVVPEKPPPKVSLPPDACNEGRAGEAL